jgi:hypothetical protein
MDMGKRPAGGRSEPPRLDQPRLYGLTDTLGRAALIPRHLVVPREEERQGLLQARAFDPARTVLLEEAPVFPRRVPVKLPREEGIRWFAYRPNSLLLQASCSGPRMLLLSEADYPGWEVWVDGRREKIYRANHAFRAVALGAGIHEVRFEYRPQSFYWGLVITLATLGGIILGILLLLRSRKKERIRTAMARGTGQVVAEHPEG